MKSLIPHVPPNIDIDSVVHLDKFVPRDYQLPIFDAIENKGYKRVIWMCARRGGKDVTSWNLTIRAALRKVGVYFYIFPYSNHARKVIWDSITNDGLRFLDFIPPRLIEATNSQELKIRLKNGSLIQLVGSSDVDKLVGTNPSGIVFSEYALQNPRVYQLLRPALTAIGGWALFISTPRGKNSFYELWNIAKNNPDEWFHYKLTVEDTNHIDLEEIDKERRSGEMSEDLIQQEYYCSFEMGVEGAYYAKYIDKLKLNDQIGIVPYEPAFQVHTAWDIGVRDSTCIIFFQTIGQTIRIIDYYEKSKEGLEHYVGVLQAKGYNYGKHIAPHDIAVREWGSGVTRIEKARQLGINFIIAPQVFIADGIEAVRSCLSKVWIDERNCSRLINALENYRQEWDPLRQVYKANPLHNFASHGADAMRYLAVSLPKTKDGISSEERDRIYRQVMYGEEANMPSIFRNDLPRY